MDTDKGLFLSFDGVPRSGRTHQADALAASLTADGHDVVRVSLDHGDTPLAKTDRAWLTATLERAQQQVTDVIAPALSRGAIVIADGWVTSALLRAQAYGVATPGAALVHEERAMRDAPVDVEWIFGDSAPPHGTPPGYASAIGTREMAACSTPDVAFPAVAGLGSRRRLTAIVRGAWHDGIDRTFLGHASDVIAERRGPAWAKVVAETREARDLALVRARMTAWTGPATMPAFTSVAAVWHLLSDDARLLVAKLAPVREDVAVSLRRLGSTSRAVDKAVVAKIVRIGRKVKQAARAAKEAAQAA